MKIMGDRGQVRLVSEGSPDIYLYTHWNASSLMEVVADALKRGKGRWNDDEYLNRIIFSEMIKDDVMSETSFGIGTSQHEDVWRVVTVYHDTKFVEVTEIDKVWSFDSFITAFANVTV
jgi:hypothetical protein